MMHPDAVWCIVELIDMRRGIDGLSLQVQTALGKTPCDGTAYALCNRRGTRLKLLIWDGTGVWLCQRRLHQGSFVWPRADASHVVLTEAQWQWLNSGVDWQRLARAAPAH
ncbi:IS66 family insertion sequence element accessory protein TnpB [Glaciimonas sp. GG7]